MNETWTVHGTIVEIIDGDTVKVDLDLGWKVGLNNELVRLLGINAPEKTTDQGKAAKAFLERLLPVGTRVEVVSQRWGGETEKFGRALARVATPAGDVGQALLAAGHAKSWDGKGVRPV